MAAYEQSFVVHVEYNGGIWGIRMMGAVLGPGEQPSAEMGGGTCSYGADCVCVCVCARACTHTHSLDVESAHCGRALPGLALTLLSWLPPPGDTLASLPCDRRGSQEEAALVRAALPTGLPCALYLLLPPGSQAGTGLLIWLSSGCAGQSDSGASAPRARPGLLCLHRTVTLCHSRLILRVQAEQWEAGTGMKGHSWACLLGRSLQVRWRASPCR